MDNDDVLFVNLKNFLSPTKVHYMLLYVQKVQ